MSAHADDVVVSEARWPMAATVIVAIVLNFLLPSGIRLASPWVLAAVQGALLVAARALERCRHVNHRTDHWSLSKPGKGGWA